MTDKDDWRLLGVGLQYVPILRFPFLAFGPEVLQNDKAVFRIRIRRIRKFLDLMDPHPDAKLLCKDPDPSINEQKYEEKNPLYNSRLEQNLEALSVPYLCFHMELMGVTGRQMSSNRCARIGVHHVIIITRAGRENPISGYRFDPSIG
jgi:hypothetical protein